MYHNILKFVANFSLICGLTIGISSPVLADESTNNNNVLQYLLNSAESQKEPSIAVYTIGSNSARFDAETKTIVSPIIVKGHMMVNISNLPFASISNSSGSQGIVNFYFVGLGGTVEGKEDSNILEINSGNISMPEPITLIGSNFFISLASIAKACGFNVYWDSQSESVTVVKPGISYEQSKYYFGPDTVYIPTITCSSGDYISKTYSWAYKGTPFVLTIQIPKILVEKANWFDMFYKKYFSSSGSEQEVLRSNIAQNCYDMLKENYASSPEGDYQAYITENYTEASFLQTITNTLLSIAKQQNYSYIDTANFISRFVQSIPYVLYTVEELPVYTLVNGGKCSTKSVLLATLLRDAGYNVALINYPSNEVFVINEIDYDGHEQVGIRLDGIPNAATVSANGINYDIIESTSPSDIGDNDFGFGLSCSIYPIPGIAN